MPERDEKIGLNVYRSPECVDKMNTESLEPINIESINISGFVGFKIISELKINPSCIPEIKGVYLVIRPDNTNVEFVKKGSGGFFKDKNPNVPINELRNNWIDEAQIIYIGKAGGSDSNSNLKSRLKEYLNFGQGKKVGHSGGRYIWQIKDINNYIICWKELPNDEPRIIEKQLLEAFKQKFNDLPFANLSN